VPRAVRVVVPAIARVTLVAALVLHACQGASSRHYVHQSVEATACGSTYQLLQACQLCFLGMGWHPEP
jgi:DMSO reductase anchor subunit